MMEQMTPAGVDPSDFVLNWIQGFKASAGPINGFPVSDRSVDAGLVGIWPKKQNGKLDLAAAPFKLLAIVNRSDLHEIGDGEGRFIYGMFLNGVGQSFTVIFEFGLPTVNATTQAAITRQNWISQFHALGAVPFGSTFNADLQAITDQFTTAGKAPSKPNGSAINQLRTNEIQFGGPWQLREFHLVKGPTGTGALTLAPAAQTPDDSLNNSTALANYVQANRFHIIGGLASLTSSLVGGQSNENSLLKTWSFPSFPAIDEETRHAFSGQTCNGCHNGETRQIDGFYQVSPRVAPGPDGTGSVSDFIKNNEFPRRKRFMQNRLVCKPDFSDCAPGAEPMP
jgi:hypothetical protein